jgi:hypothetical protein
MTRCEVIEKTSPYDLEKAIQNLLNSGASITHIAMTSTKYGYTGYYCATIIYEK